MARRSSSWCIPISAWNGAPLLSEPACPSEELDPAGTSNSMNVRLTEQKSTLFQRLAVPL
jgi:hypothetical protein